MTIGKKLIEDCYLSLNEAEEVHESIRELYEEGVWDTPDWAVELSEHLKVATADVVILFTAWRALAIAYRKVRPTEKGSVLSDRQTRPEV